MEKLLDFEVRAHQLVELLNQMEEEAGDPLDAMTVSTFRKRFEDLLEGKYSLRRRLEVMKPYQERLGVIFDEDFALTALTESMR